METQDATVIPYHKSNRGRTANVPKSIPKQTRKAAAGRKAFQTDECEYHGKADDGSPCAKFSHLRTDGLGIHKPPFYRTVIVTLTKAIRPLIIAGIAFSVYYLATHVVFRALHVSNGLPNPTNSGVSNNVRHSQTHSVPNSRNKPSSSPTRIHRHDAVSVKVK